MNPSKHNFYDFQREDYIESKSVEEILKMLDIDVDVSYSSLEISDDNDFQIHLRRTSTSCFVNNYFKFGLEKWEANMDIQPVFNEKKAVDYMCAYLSKSEDTFSNAMKQALLVKNKHVLILQIENALYKKQYITTYQNYGFGKFFQV